MNTLIFTSLRQRRHLMTSFNTYFHYLMTPFIRVYHWSCSTSCHINIWKLSILPTSKHVHISVFSTVIQTTFLAVLFSSPKKQPLKVLDKKVFVKISQNSLGSFSFSITLQVSGWPRACKFLQALTQVFSYEFMKFLRTPFLENTSGRLLLYP